MLCRNRGHCKVAKAVEAVGRGNPDIAFAVLKEKHNGITRQAVRQRKHIRPSIVYMQQAPVIGADPQAAIAISEQLHGHERRRHTWKWVRHCLPVNELFDASPGGDYESAILALTQTLKGAH